MSTLFRTPSFRGWSAIILHKPHADRDAVYRQLGRLGIDVETVWPDLPETARQSDLVIFDADAGHDGQFPWPVEEHPMPMIALMGSEAPGRVEWAIRRGAIAQLSKPIASSGVYGALVVATQTFAMRKASEQRIARLETRLACRPQVAEAILLLMQHQGGDAATAYKLLQDMAMASRQTIEDVALGLLGRTGGQHDGRRKA
ncbi:ANTAR domain-containing response regulator [Roseibium sediminicola]|uniref:ANTAR domain-containing protein n=1 Tax=Roseibium sediminicola TaxID=2933272 RepID=A0ABT0GWL6_9HYPH|nr:ANTAR domain-containing protein [Roseibium sp. CAU 1639]MCK7613839.1 ANTAR domain-containing protein [Roseibium sp. CAU 1639]